MKETTIKLLHCECQDDECGAVFFYSRVCLGRSVPPTFCPECGGDSITAIFRPECGGDFVAAKAAR